MTDRYKAVVTNMTATAHLAAHPNGDYVRFADYERLRAALALIATPPRPDGTWNRDRQACYELAKQELERTL